MKEKHNIPILKKFLRETIVAVRFGLVGIAATLIHILIVSILFARTSLDPIIANTIAFLFAFGFSFIGHYFWTFQSPGNPDKAIRRLLLISGSAYAVNTLLLKVMLHAGWFSNIASAVFSASVIPLITYSASRLWAFKSTHRKSIDV